MSSRHHTHVVVGGLAVLALAVGVPTAAMADTEDWLSIDNLPGVTDADLEDHIRSIDVPDIDPVSVPDIEPFEPEVTSDGGDTVVSLDTDVLFDFGKADLGDGAKDAVAEAVKDVPDGAKVRVEGHTDSVGPDRENQALSKQRAQAVADAIAASRDDLDLTVAGKGEKDPVEPNSQGGKDNPAGREKNRRVEIRYAD